jgi:hypothetical protein
VREKRKKIWIDRFQTYLSLRIALYFILYQVAVWFLVIIGQNLHATMTELIGQSATTYCLFFVGTCVVFLGVLFIYDALVMTHRIVGPLYRFRKTIQGITAGEEVSLVTLRKDDFLKGMQDDFNDMLLVLHERGAVTLKLGTAKEKQPLSV